MQHSNELELLKRSVNGDTQAFSELLEGYYSMIYRTAYKWTGNKEDSEDIAQDVCIKIGQSLRSFRMDSKFSTWVYRIVLNAVKDFQRKKRNHFNLEDTPELAMAENVSAESYLQSKELWKHIQNLPAKQRDAVMLVYGEELTHNEVAIILKCKESTVSWYIHEAKKQLKLMM